MKENQYRITNLTCANCAAKIENKLKEMEGLQDVRLDFIAKKLTLAFTDSFQKSETILNVQRIIDDIEPGVKIHEIGDDEGFMDDDYHGRQKLWRLLIGIAIFIATFIIPRDKKMMVIVAVSLNYILIGGDIVYRAIRNIIKGRLFDENTLMTIATIGAFGIGEYHEAVAVMLFYQVGEFFQDLAVNRSRRSIRNLLSIKPELANVQINQSIVEMKVEDVNVQDRIVIKPGERIPLDGIILEGTSTLDMKALTGESLPVNVTVGEQVLSGSINMTRVLVVQVTKLAHDSTVSKILTLVEHASSQKARTENFVTKFARVYTPLVCLFALLLAVVPPLLIEGSFFEWFHRSLIFLVISCPCALVISIPLGFFGGIGAASRNGILVKGGNYLEALNTIEIAVFDKTGTLTRGTFTVTDIHAVGEYSQKELLGIAAHLESYSNHPIAISIVQAYGNEIDQSIVTDVQEHVGLGITGIVNGKYVIIGNRGMMEKEKIVYQAEEACDSILYVAVNHQYVGYITISDQVKEDSAHTIKLLKQMGVKKTVMLTGDREYAAKQINRTLRIDEVYAHLLPEEKLDILEGLLNQTTNRGKLLYVGDGINDTPVLARADVGIAMGGLGSDAAIDVADVVIMTDEPSKIVQAIDIAKRTRTIVWQNIIFSLAVKVFFLILGALGFATMWEAVIADVGVSIIAIINAMRVLKYNGGRGENV